MYGLSSNSISPIGEKHVNLNMLANERGICLGFGALCASIATNASHELSVSIQAGKMPKEIRYGTKKVMA
jgi:hypothetical protein